MSSEPSFRTLFYTEAKRPEVYFYTSNVDKYLQASAVFDRYGLPLSHFRSVTDPYDEDYSLDTSELLARALGTVTRSIGGAYLLFVEDTSLRIDALSGASDFPGLAVKDWFAQTTFEQLDRELRGRSNQRAATVKSDIALRVPGLSRPLYFHGETAGAVAETPPAFSQSPTHPWLTPHSFNGWFRPDGAAKRLGEMSFEESWQYDFRVKSLVALIDRLEEYFAVLNLPAQAYTRIRPARDALQTPLFSPVEGVIMVVGRTCAGKTTFGQHAARQHDFRVIEASDVMGSFRPEFPSAKGAFELAAKVIDTKGADVVARQILDLLAADPVPRVAITGFRTIEEVETVLDKVPGAKLVVVESDERTRYGRYLGRGRGQTVQTLREFRLIDELQVSLGLLDVASELADLRIENQGSLEDYRRQVDAVLSGEPQGVAGIDRNGRARGLETSQLIRCLTVLADAGRSLSTEEIEDATGQTGRRIRHNNANKVLKRHPELARRLEAGDRVRYEIRSAGRAYLRLMKRTGSES